MAELWRVRCVGVAQHKCLQLWQVQVQVQCGGAKQHKEGQNVQTLLAAQSTKHSLPRIAHISACLDSQIEQID